MATSNPSPAGQLGRTDHLTVRPEDIGPPEVHFQFEQQQQRIGNAVGVSVLTHGAVLVILFLAFRLAPEPARTAVLPDRISDRIVWLSDPGPGGGGGGGGNRAPEPPKKAEAPGKDKITVPVVKPPEIAPVQKPKDPEPTEAQQLNIPAKTMAADAAVTPGVIESNAPTGTASQGSGSGGGAGTGTGSGVGQGTGSGLGAGSGGGTGGGVYRPGNGVEVPRLIRQVRPNYTSEAMRAKVQGVVLLECVVETDGSVGSCGVQRSLDSTFGLDQEALKAAKQWRFQPGTRLGQPVPVLVSIELSFTLR